ncbi:hypothetical protein BKA66DRAFT_451303 [Pyrenochaeta sp. MPI-SDFR-AT-0127]|nr:hypothetical protein BKA66DRAFT_451303 [Pyrenochaeta sp. MPI-SDFR-AT-0127]
MKMVTINVVHDCFPLFDRYRSRFKTKARVHVTRGEGSSSMNVELLTGAKPKGQYMRISQRNDIVCPLLKLPAELRNQIYEYVLGGRSIYLTSHEGICIGEIAPCLTPPGPGYRNADRERGALQLTQVCRQIHAEAHALVFSLNVFRYSNASQDLEVWKYQKPDALSLIQNVRLYANGTNEARWLPGLKYFPNLKRVEIAAQHVKVCSHGGVTEMEGFDARNSWEVGIEAWAKQISHPHVHVIFYRR